MEEQTPEQIAERRKALMDEARGHSTTHGVPTPETPPPPSASDTGWKMDLDLEATKAEARRQEAESPIRAIGLGENPWRAEPDELLHVDESGHAASPVRRSVDMRMSNEYGEQSRQAISVINKFFASKECSELHFNEPDRIFAKVSGKRVQLKDPSTERALSFTSEEDYNRFLWDLIDNADTYKTLEDIKRRSRDVVKMAGGDRLTIMLPPFTETITASIHKVVARTWKMDDLITKRTLTPDMARFLTAAVRAKANILVIGEMGAGKSTMLSLLAQSIGQDERVALIEEVPEIFLDQPDVKRITYYPNSVTDVPMGLAQVLDTALYMRFDRVMVGEIHEFGMYHMLRVMSNGGDGSMSTFHADNAQQALIQVQNNVQREEGIQAPNAAHFIRRAIDLVVAIERIDDVHRVTEITEVAQQSLSDTSEAFPLNQLYIFDRDLQEFRKVGHPEEFGKLRRKAKKHHVDFPPEWFAGEDYGVR